MMQNENEKKNNTTSITQLFYSIIIYYLFIIFTWYFLNVHCVLFSFFLTKNHSKNLCVSVNLLLT